MVSVTAGYGLVCHRVIKSICELAGIKDIYVKVDGPTRNILAMSRAFLNGLHKQVNYQVTIRFSLCNGRARIVGRFNPQFQR